MSYYKQLQVPKDPDFTFLCCFIILRLFFPYGLPTTFSSSAQVLVLLAESGVIFSMPLPVENDGGFLHALWIYFPAEHKRKHLLLGLLFVLEAQQT